MEISFIRLDEHIARFILSGATPAFANSFRRAMISEVPTLAIEDVMIYDNNSVLFDEILAHRLGLIPLKTDLTAYVPRNECSCDGKGCSSCQAIYTLSVEGTEGGKIVYSSDLIPQDPDTIPVDGNIPLVKLQKDQKVVLEARAELNTGKEHAKWESTLACGYKNYPIIKVDDRCDACGMCVEECPKGVLVLKPGSKYVEVADGKLESCSLCKLCERACMAGGIGNEPAIHIISDKTRYIFVVESDGSLPVNVIMERAFLYIKEKSESLMDVLSDISGRIVNEES